MFNPNIKILVIDDMSMMRKAIIKFCTEYGFSRFDEASGGNEAWDKIDAAKPPYDLVISDWNMGGLNGIELLRKIRADKRFSKTPVLMVTAEKEKEQILEAIKAGVSGYVVKPFTTQTLFEKLKAVYDKSAA